MSSSNFRDFVPPPDHPRIAGLSTTTPEEYSAATLARPVVAEIVAGWKANLEEPFYGVTSDGRRREGLFHLVDQDEGVDEGEGAPVAEMVPCAERIINLLTPDELKQLLHPVDSDEWRKWSNPEFLIYRTGIRLEDLAQEKVTAILALLRASTSEAGYARLLGAMKTNRFLGELCHASSIMNERSYQFTLYGTPSRTEPWGYSLFGHHLCLNIFVLGSQMVVTPMFLGAEPNIIDTGPDTNTTILDAAHAAADLPPKIMRSLPRNLQEQARVYAKLHDDKMPPGRWNPADQRHLAGAFQDNRIIPYEGIRVSAMPPEQQAQLRAVVSGYFEFLPAGPYAARMCEVERFWEGETWFCWIGEIRQEERGNGDSDGDGVFYYRIQSPVVLIEFDHHSGVFLLNKEPARYHVHTVVRTPNGGDYGRGLLRRWREKNRE
ncbi:hypothetical protein BJY01DRAFT_213450 [Aspergillus pseudoustus]|uniref:Uncharacterized protein n=1 Tax=Aspergillus pseudoustus TaxID=1810923 RepID=A0ABR4K315_9EURO